MPLPQWSSIKTGRPGVAIAFSELARAALLAWVPISPRLASQRLIKAYYASTKMKVRASGIDFMPFEIRFGVRQGCVLFPTLFNNIITRILAQALQGYSGVQVGANVHVPDLAYADFIAILSDATAKC